jgi:hypothetical protein
MCYFPLDCPNPESYVFRLTNDEIVLTDEILCKVQELCDCVKPKPKAFTNSHRPGSSNEKDMLLEDYLEYQIQS